MRSPPDYAGKNYRDRPRDYSAEVFDRVVERYENGESLAKIAEDRDMPLPATVLHWIEDDPVRRARWEMAVVIQTEVLVDQMVPLIDSSRDVFKTNAMLNARRWRAERLVPKRYSSKSINYLVTPDSEVGVVDHRESILKKLVTIVDRAGKLKENMRAAKERASEADESSDA